MEFSQILGSAKQTELNAVYLLVKFPIGIAAFVLLTASASITGVFLTSPFTYSRWTLNIGSGDGAAIWWINTLPEAVLASAIALFILLPVSILVINGVAWVWKQFAVLMLGRLSLPSAKGEDRSPMQPLSPTSPFAHS